MLQGCQLFFFLFFFLDNRGVQASLQAPQLIPWVCKPRLDGNKSPNVCLNWESNLKPNGAQPTTLNHYATPLGAATRVSMSYPNCYYHHHHHLGYNNVLILAPHTPPLCYLHI